MNTPGAQAGLGWAGQQGAVQSAVWFSGVTMAAGPLCHQALRRVLASKSICWGSPRTCVLSSVHLIFAECHTASGILLAAGALRKVGCGRGHEIMHGGGRVSGWHGGLARLGGSAPLRQQVAREARGWAAQQGGGRRRSEHGAEGQAASARMLLPLWVQKCSFPQVSVFSFS